MPFRFKLKKAYIKAECTEFDHKPCWELLTSRIGENFGISSTDVRLTFVLNGEECTLKDDGHLQLFYTMHKSSEMTFVVQDLKFPDSSGAISAVSTGALLMSRFSFHLPTSPLSL